MELRFPALYLIASVALLFPCLKTAEHRTVAGAGPISTQQTDWAELWEEGKLLLAAKQYQIAEQKLDEAARAARKSGVESLQLAEILCPLAEARLGSNQLKAAESAVKEALEIREKVLGKQHLTVAATLDLLATVYWVKVKPFQDDYLYLYHEGIVQIGGAVDTQRAPESQWAVVENAGVTVVEHTVPPEYGKTESALKRALEIREAALPESHPEVIATLNRLAALYMGQLRNSQAEPLIERVLRAREKTLGPEHPTVAASLAILSRIHARERRRREAATLLARAVTILERAPGIPWVELAYLRLELAEHLIKLQQFSEAEPLYTLVLRALENGEKREHSIEARLLELNVAQALKRWAVVLRKLNRITEADMAEKRATAILEKHRPAKH